MGTKRYLLLHETELDLSTTCASVCLALVAPRPRTARFMRSNPFQLLFNVRFVAEDEHSPEKRAVVFAIPKNSVTIRDPNSKVSHNVIMVVRLP
jgi:hypothetical protein